MKKITILLSLFSFFAANNLKAQTAQLWGMTPVGGHDNGGVIFKINVGGGGFDTVYSFNTDIQVGGGDSPHGDLLAGPNGILYGITFYGGTNNNGTIFSFDSATHAYTDLHDFDSATGEQSWGSLILATDGDLYGMTSVGGSHNFGVIFRFNPDSDTYADVHDFDSTHGGNPYGNLLQVSGGKMYGMTQYGGSSNSGVIFSFDPSANNYTSLFELAGTNGSYPYGSLIQSGNKLYGLTSEGGASTNGTIFNYTISSNTFTKLYDFNYDSGGSPDGNLTQLSNGIFYGTANSGGTNGDGVIFTYDTLTDTYHDKFNFNGPLGQSPPSGLLLAGDDNLYGLTFYGGTDTDGVIFDYTLSDSECSDIHNFNNIEGGSPNGNLIQLGKTSGINQVATNNTQLLIYPNPASNQLIITSNQFAVKQIKIENMLGQAALIYTVTNNTNINFKETLDISSLCTGMYFVSVVSENKVLTTKLSIIGK